MMMMPEMFIRAETEYRRERMIDQYAQHRPRRHKVRRRPFLRLPRPRRRVQAVT